MSQRIVILGPSNSGKSTLAARIAAFYGLKLLHLDVIAHVADTAWQRRPHADFEQAQADFLREHAGWVIDGNYSGILAARLALADTVIWCDLPRAGCLWRYMRRSWQADPARPGRLPGAKGEFSWSLMRYIWRQYPKNRLIYARMIAENPHLDVVRLDRFSQVRRFDLRRLDTGKA